MKRIFSDLALFIVLAIALSSLTGCPAANNPNGNAPPSNINTASSGNSGNTGNNTEVKNSEFPPPPSALAQADIKGLDGNTFKIADRKGQVVLLNLWATWCRSCRQEMPELVAMQNKYADKNFKVVGLNTDDEEADKIKEFAAEMKLNYELAWLDRPAAEGVMKFTRFSGIPQSFLIDREGRLRGVFMGGGPKIVGQMKETVEKVVAE